MTIHVSRSSDPIVLYTFLKDFLAVAKPQKTARDVYRELSLPDDSSLQVVCHPKLNYNKGFPAHNVLGYPLREVSGQDEVDLLAIYLYLKAEYPNYVHLVTIKDLVVPCTLVLVQAEKLYPSWQTALRIWWNDEREKDYQKVLHGVIRSRIFENHKCEWGYEEPIRRELSSDSSNYSETILLAHFLENIDLETLVSLFLDTVVTNQFPSREHFVDFLTGESPYDFLYHCNPKYFRDEVTCPGFELPKVKDQKKPYTEQVQELINYFEAQFCHVFQDDSPKEKLEVIHQHCCSDRLYMVTLFFLTQSKGTEVGIDWNRI